MTALHWNGGPTGKQYFGPRINISTVADDKWLTDCSGNVSQHCTELQTPAETFPFAIQPHPLHRSCMTLLRDDSGRHQRMSTLPLLLVSLDIWVALLRLKIKNYQLIFSSNKHWPHDVTHCWVVHFPSVTMANQNTWQVFTTTLPPQPETSPGSEGWRSVVVLDCCCLSQVDFVGFSMHVRVLSVAADVVLLMSHNLSVYCTMFALLSFVS